MIGFLYTRTETCITSVTQFLTETDYITYVSNAHHRQLLVHVIID